MEIKTTYSELLTDPRWQQKRLRIMHRDDFTCVKCKDKDTTLNVHHIAYHAGLKPWEYKDSELATLCKHCHFEIEELNKTEATPFNLIEIFKIKGTMPNGQKHRFMFVLHKGVCNFRGYRDDKYSFNYPFGGKKINQKLSQMFQKASEWIPSKNKYADYNDVFDEAERITKQNGNPF